MPHPTGNSSALSAHILTIVLACPVYCSKQKSHKFLCPLFFVHFQSTIIVEKTVQDLMNLMHDLSAYSDQFLNMVCVKLQEYKDTCSSAYRYSWGWGLTQCGACSSAYRYSSGGPCLSVGPGGAGSTAFLASFPAFVKGPDKKHRRDSLLGPRTVAPTKGMNGTHGQRQLRWLQWLRSRVSPDCYRDLELEVWLPQGNFRSWLVHLVSEKVLIIE